MNSTIYGSRNLFNRSHIASLVEKIIHHALQGQRDVLLAVMLRGTNILNHVRGLELDQIIEVSKMKAGL